jgi:hypothetical protein
MTIVKAFEVEPAPGYPAADYVNCLILETINQPVIIAIFVSKPNRKAELENTGVHDMLPVFIDG